MFGNSPFGFSGSGAGGGGGTIGGGGTLNYLCKFTPDGSNIGNSQLFDDGTNVGLGTITPAYGFQIGDDITQKTFFHYLGTNGNDATWFSQSISANIFRLNGDDSRILFNESGSTNWRTIFNGIGGDYPVTIRGTGSNPLYGTIQLGIQSSDSEVGLAFDNIGTSGRGYNIFSTNSGSVLGAGNFIIADSTAATYRLVINSIGNLGVGILSPTAKTHIVGVDSTTSNYTLKLDNSSSSPLLYVRNDGNIGIGYSNPSFAKVQVENSINDLKASWFSINSNTGTSSGQQIYMDNGVQSFSSGILGVSTTNWNSYGNPKDAFIRYGTSDGSTGNINFISPITGLGGAYNFYAYRAVSGGIPTLGIKGSFISVNLDVASASANIHAKGDDSTSANFVLKADDSGNTNIIKARNDGYVIQRANNSAISDGSLANSELSFYIDEGGNTLTVKVKYSGGTIKTGIVALV